MVSCRIIARVGEDVSSFSSSVMLIKGRRRKEESRKEEEKEEGKKESFNPETSEYMYGPLEVGEEDFWWEN